MRVKIIGVNKFDDTFMVEQVEPGPIGLDCKTSLLGIRRPRIGREPANSDSV